MTEHSLPIPFDMIPKPGEKLDEILFSDLMRPLLRQAHGLALMAQHGIVGVVNDLPDHPTHLQAALMLLSDILALANSTFEQWDRKDSRRHHPKTPNGAKTTA